MGDMAGGVHLWDVRTGQSLRNFVGHTSWVPSVAFAPDGKTAASGSLDGTSRVWDVETGETIRVFDNETGIGCVAFAPDGQTILFGEYWANYGKFTMRWWDVNTGEILRDFEGHSWD